MASARAQMGALRRKIGKRQKRANVASGIFSTLGTVAAFGAGQAKKAETAWGEYEAGYEALGGEGFERPKFGKGYFKGPKGEISIGTGKERRTYDMGQIQKAGSFLGSDAAAILDPEQRQQYLGRTAPGRYDPLTSKLQSPLTQMTGDTGTGFGTSNVRSFSFGGEDILAGTSTEKSTIFADPLTLGKETGGIGVKGPDYLKDYKPSIAGGERGRGAAETVGIQTQQRQTTYTPSRQHAMPGPNVNIDIPSMIKKRFLGGFTTGGHTGEGGGTGVKTGVSQIPENPYSYQNMLNAGTDQVPSYAGGGDFITNGPQEILVGDNPGGREMVSIRPLPSINDEEYPRKRNWLESLYENNRRRKNY